MKLNFVLLFFGLPVFLGVQLSFAESNARDLGDLNSRNLAQMKSRNVTFPKGCPGDNLKQICESLSQISPNQTLVFADGTELPACFMTSPMKEDAQDIELEKKLNRELVYMLRRQLGDQTLASILPLFYDLQSLRERLQVPEDILQKMDQLIDLKKKRRTKQYKRTQSTEEEFKYAKSKIEELVAKNPSKDPKVNKYIYDRMNATWNFKVPNQYAITCRPMINAANIPGMYSSNMISVFPGLTHYPKPTLIRIIGHEISHNFDVCMIGSDKNNPYHDLVSCLQNEVGEFRMSSKIQAPCDYHAREAFCDYFGAYALENWIKDNPPKKPVAVENPKPDHVYLPAGFEYIFFDLDGSCLELSDPTPDKERNITHPSPQKRLKSIMLKNPTIAGAVGCKVDKETYRCDISKGAVGEKPSLFKKLYNKYKESRP